MNIVEMNNIRKDSDVAFGSHTVTKTSPVVEVFSAMVNGESLDKFGAKADKAVEYIKGLGTRAMDGDFNAISELNTIRRFTIENPVMQEIKLLGIFGSYQNVGYDETIEREIRNHSGERSRQQANNGDVVFPVTTVERYQVPTFTVSGGYAVDYRRVSKGDMTFENEGIAEVKTDILNNAKKAIVNKVYNAIKNATGVKYVYEGNSLQKTGVDGILTAIRRFGRPTVIGDYAIISQFTPWAGYVGTINSTTITGVSQKVLDEIAANGVPAMYNGAILAEMENPYDLNDPTGSWSDGTNTTPNFQTLLPAGLAFVIPTGAKSPIATWTRGGLTSMTGTDVKTGKLVTRFDLEVAADIAKGQEYKIGTIFDTTIGGLS